MNFKHVNLVGIEFEGAWDDLPESMAPYYHGDGSVTAVSTFVGEISSPPMKPDELYDFIMDKEIYPSRINSSCGMHIHFSPYDVNDFVAMADIKFKQGFKDSMQHLGEKILKLPEDHSYWYRLSGRNTYCLGSFDPWSQLGETRTNEYGAASRYCQLNFSAYHTHGTLENRLFPMFQKRTQAKQAAQHYLEFVEKYLRDQKIEKKLSETVTVEIPEDAVFEIAA
jgi:hypothetical protein